MTASVCIFCGSMKVGAWTPCDSCGQVPRTERESIVALVATDRYHDESSLEKLARHVRKGGTIDVDRSTEKEIRELLQATRIQEVAASMGVQSPSDGMNDNRSSAGARPAKRWEFWKRGFTAHADVRVPGLEAKALESAKVGDWDAALHYLTDALRQGARAWTVRANRGKALLHLRRYQEAIADFSEALGHCPDDAKAAVLNDRGTARRQAGALDGAIADYTAALEFNPAFGRALLNRGTALLQDGDEVAGVEDILAASSLGVEEADNLLAALRSAKSGAGSHESASVWSYRGRTQSDFRWRFESTPACNSVRRRKNGKAALVANDASHIVRSLAHLWLRWLPEREIERGDGHEMLLRLEGWAGVVDGDWSAEQEEKVAKQIEAYMLTWPEARALWHSDCQPPAPTIVPILAELMRLFGKPGRTP